MRVIVHKGDKTIDVGRFLDERQIEQGDIVAAQRGLNMVAMSLADLRDLVSEHQGKAAFASRVIVLGAKQMIAAKTRSGARDHWIVHSRVQGYEILEGAGVDGGEWAVRYPNGNIVKVDSQRQAREHIHLEAGDV